MRPRAPAGRPRLVWGLAGAALLAILVLSQEQLATGLGRLLANVWVSTVGAVLSLLGAFFGN